MICDVVLLGSLMLIPQPASVLAKNVSLRRMAGRRIDRNLDLRDRHRNVFCIVGRVLPKLIGRSP
ncbi:hypothetical protein [Pseudomonas syringae]|uniref:hypothetical protein n=1 Tax=Pseudomonas syringae TaxID=317 RepID=UPI002248A925|nr:hypothetical protein [Pseudomonas syringae]UZS69250.1 hypothetical protein OQB65_07850 [Pseudomonas syringae]